MKGSPQEPKCGFSRQIVEILNSKNIDYATFDILEDNEVRQGKVNSILSIYRDLQIIICRKHAY